METGTECPSSVIDTECVGCEEFNCCFFFGGVVDKMVSNSLYKCDTRMMSIQLIRKSKDEVYRITLKVILFLLVQITLCVTIMINYLFLVEEMTKVIDLTTCGVILYVMISGNGYYYCYAFSE